MQRGEVHQQIRDLLEFHSFSSQEEIREKLLEEGFDVTQSTISRTLKKLGVVRTFDENGRGIYKLTTEEPSPPDVGLAELVVDITANEMQIVIGTKPGCAGLIARHLDYYRPAELLGTIAGDDAIFVCPKSVGKIPQTLKEIRRCLNL